MGKARILFLEDDANRIAKARRGFVGYDLTVVTTAREAIDALKTERFDLVSLDHDLGGTQMAESDENSGHAVAQFIAKMPSCPAVLVHSFNPVGAENMMNCLRDRLCVKALCIRVLFDTPGYWQLALLAA